MKKFIVVLTMLLLTAACTSKENPQNARIRNVEDGLVEFKFGPQQDDSPPQKNLGLTDRMVFHNIPGVSMAVIDGNKIVWAKAYGVTSAETLTPANTDSLFEAASTTKLLVSTLVHHFVEKGQIDLDEDVNTYLKSWKVPENEYTEKRRVTLRLLLSHRSGLNRPEGGFSAEEGSAPTLVQVMNGEPPALNKGAVLEFVPGSKWQYSNLGYILVQLILEDTTGKSLSHLAEEIIFKPLGMFSSTLEYPLPKDWQTREIAPHDAEGAAHTPEMHPTAVAPGGLITTPSDLALLTIELMKAFQGSSDLVLKEETIRQMFHIEMDLDPSILGFVMGQGLGAFIWGDEENMSFGHPGDNFPGASSWLMGYPALGKGVVIMTNGAKGNLLALEILAALEEEYSWPPFKM